MPVETFSIKTIFLKNSSTHPHTAPAGTTHEQPSIRTKTQHVQTVDVLEQLMTKACKNIFLLSDVPGPQSS
jgi:hypothetical protein